MAQPAPTTTTTAPNTITPVEVGDKSLASAIAYAEQHYNTLQQRLLEAGALRFRGFAVRTPKDFQELAKVLAPELKDEYLGTSPRNPVAGTEYVFSASELPPHYPIMQHCEMSFLPNPPSRLLFFGHLAPLKGGETPLCDFRKVAADMDPEIKAEFKERGVRHVRNYNSLKEKNKLTLWQLKRWDELFGTTDPEEVTAKLKAEDTEFEWLPGGKLRILNPRPAFQTHPDTGEEVWFNHLQVFHRDAAEIEYEHIINHDKGLRNYLVNGVVHLLTGIKRKRVAPMDLPMHVQYGDGGEIPKRVVEHIQGLIWKHLRIEPWQRGDVLLIDNNSTSHGRLPYSGARDIMVAWA